MPLRYENKTANSSKDSLVIFFNKRIALRAMVDLLGDVARQIRNMDFEDHAVFIIIISADFIIW